MYVVQAQSLIPYIDMTIINSANLIERADRSNLTLCKPALACGIQQTATRRQYFCGSTNMPRKPYSITMMNGDTVTALFGEATAEQQIECYTLSSSAWASYLDEDEVIAREKHLSVESLSRDGGRRTWCLYRQDDPGSVLSTCKTLRRDFRLENTGNTHQVGGYCITSVCTATLYRGHGLASHMLRNVTDWLDGPGQALVSVLYSGIPQFYERLGWNPVLDMEVILNTSAWLYDVLGPYAKISVRPLRDADIEELCAKDTESLMKQYKQSESTPEKTRLTILPTADVVKYQHGLSNYMGELWHYEIPEIRGAAYEDQAWLYWFHDFRGRCLYVQRVHDSISKEDPEAHIMTALFLCAIREAKEWNFTSIATWDTTSRVRKALQTLAQASVFSKSVSESHRKQKMFLRLRDGDMDLSSIVMDNEAFSWNLRY